MQDVIEIDEDLLANSARSLETLVSVGMKLGVSKKQADIGLPNLDNCVLQDWEVVLSITCFNQPKSFLNLLLPNDVANDMTSK